MVVLGGWALSYERSTPVPHSQNVNFWEMSEPKRGRKRENQHPPQVQPHVGHTGMQGHLAHKEAQGTPRNDKSSNIRLPKNLTPSP